MNVLNKKHLSLVETKSYLKDLDEKTPVNLYLKKFAKLSTDKTKKLGEEIRALNNPKIREEDIVKVIDFLPQDAEAVNKIFLEVSLSEEEINKVLEIVKKY
jgi:DNA-directed RNA polymerase subunit F